MAFLHIRIQSQLLRGSSDTRKRSLAADQSGDQCPRSLLIRSQSKVSPNCARMAANAGSIRFSGLSATATCSWRRTRALLQDLFFVARFSFWKPSSRERAVRQALCNELHLLRWSPRTHSSLVDGHRRRLVVIHRFQLEVQGLAQFLPQLKYEPRKAGMESRLGRPDLADHMIGRTTKANDGCLGGSPEVNQRTRS